jgi:hypothetical protein
MKKILSLTVVLTILVFAANAVACPLSGGGHKGKHSVDSGSEEV